MSELVYILVDARGTVQPGTFTQPQDLTQPVYAGFTQLSVALTDPRIILPAPPPEPKPTPLQWLRRLTLDKQQAIFAAAASNSVVLGWLFEADGAGGIDVTDPATAQGVAAIAAAVPVITAADQAILLAP